MANTLRGRVYEINSSNQFLFPKGVSNLDGGKGFKVNSIIFSMPNDDTSGVLQLGVGDSATTKIILQLDKNTPSINFGGQWFSDVIVTTISGGTGYLYFE